MTYYAAPVANLIEELSKLPGIGPKSAQRLAFYLLKVSSEEANKLAEAIRLVKEKTCFCEICFNIADEKICQYCRDARRDDSVICVVEEPRDIIALEKTKEFR